MRARGAAPALVVVALTALTGCGENRDGATATTTPRIVPQPGPRVIVVSLSEYRLQPSNPRATGPGVITLEAINDGTVAHAIAVSGPEAEARTRAIAPGEHAALKVRLPAGTFKWACPLANHERLGMTGRIRVGA